MSCSRNLAMTLSLALCAACGSSRPGGAEPELEAAAAAPLAHPGELHFGSVRQLTRGAGENAEAYWSLSGDELIFQSKRAPYECDQIFRVPADGSAPPELVSSGKGRTTCSHFFPGDDRILYSSTEAAGDDCPPTPDMSQGYVWPIYSAYEIFTARPDGSDVQKLTDSPGYDAEATICPTDGSIVFTSTRDGDLELYRMDADGSNVVRLTDAAGYDGGAFFSADCQKIVWRASRPTGDELADYQRLLEQGLVRPTELELWVADADGKNARQVTYLGAASFGPFFHPSGERILFSTNHPEPRGREFDLWAVDVDGTDLERITFAEGFDGFPMFSPDGTRLAFGSNRNQAEPGETDVYVAEWRDEPRGEIVQTAADRFAADVAWLADDAREGRSLGTPGLDASAAWIARRFADIGVDPAFESSYQQALRVPVTVARGAGTRLVVAGKAAADTAFVPVSFSSEASVSGRSVFVGHGVVAADLEVDDYAGKKVKGKIVVIRDGVPADGAFAEADRETRERYRSLHYKAFTARERGAAGVVFVDLPAKSETERELPSLSLARNEEVGIPVVFARAAIAEPLTRRSRKIALAVDLDRSEKPTSNVVGVVRAGAATKLPGAVVIGAHYDHLGYGEDGSSLAPGERVIHNGADDNASGVAGLLEVARVLQARRAELARDVYLVAFTAEELGILGSRHFVHEPPPGLEMKDVVAMLNMDMIGRLRDNTVAVLGGATATEWEELVTTACEAAAIRCTLGGSGYGPSDQTRFYAMGVPVLQWFTGTHADYHKPSDDTSAVNHAGGAQVAAAVAGVATAVANRTGRLSFQKVGAPRPQGDSQSLSASLGTIPDYTAADDGPGMLVAGVRPGGPAEKAGIRGGDRLLKVGDTEVRTVQDLVYVLRDARPGQTTTAIVERDGKKLELPVTFGKSTRRRGR